MQEQLAAEVQVGVVTHYWSHLGVAGVHLDSPLNVGDHVRIVGHTSNFEQDVQSIEIDHSHVFHAHPGNDIGLAVIDHAREHDKILKVVPMSEYATNENWL
jgi:hypothetical protein